MLFRSNSATRRGGTRGLEARSREGRRSQLPDRVRGIWDVILCRVLLRAGHWGIESRGVGEFAHWVRASRLNLRGVGR